MLVLVRVGADAAGRRLCGFPDQFAVAVIVRSGTMELDCWQLVSYVPLCLSLYSFIALGKFHVFHIAQKAERYSFFPVLNSSL